MRRLTSFTVTVKLTGLAPAAIGTLYTQVN